MLSKKDLIKYKEYQDFLNAGGTIDQLTDEQAIELGTLMDYHRMESGITYYNPSPKVVPFHKSEAPYRLLTGANRSGKTFSGGSELVYYATCTHPYKKDIEPDEYWVVSESYKVQEEAAQKIIMQLLPQRQIKKVSMIKSGIIDNIVIDVIKDEKLAGASKISFKSSDSGVRNFAGAAKRGIWFDEEPPYDVYQECIARMGAGKKLDVWLTMTPIFEQRNSGRRSGMSWTYRELFAKRDGERIFHIGIEIDDNIYLSKEQIEEQKKKYHGVEYDIRIKGEYKLMSGSNVFDTEALTHYIDRTKDPLQIGYLEDSLKGTRLKQNNQGHLKIWEKIRPSQRYFIGADIGLGVGQDPSCAVVLDKELKQVAELHGQISPDRMAYLLKLLGNLFNNAWIGVEANSFGISTLDNLKRKYGKLYFSYKVDERSDRRTKQIGWWTTSKTKPLMIGEFGKALRERAISLPSKQLIEELTTYILSDTGSANAELGCHDDRVIAAMIALQVRKKHVIQASDGQEDMYIPANKTTGY